MGSVQVPYVVIGVIYALALALAVLRRKSFPLTDALVILAVVGVGFTYLVYRIVPQSPVLLKAEIKPSEFVFVFGYLVLLAFFLARKTFPGVPAAWKDHFLKYSSARLLSKLVLFVLVPLAALILFWSRDWPGLGFSPGNIHGQLITAAILILLFGGLNLLTGSAAAPIRARKFAAWQVLAGLVIAFVWNILETGLVEEFFFRGMLQTHLVAVLDSPLAGIAATALLFGLFHAPGIYRRKGDQSGPLGEHPSLLNTILYTILALAPAGWFTGLLFWRTQSLLAPILVHAGVDAAASAVEFIKGLGLSKVQK
jgi:membrane protease YdiL (CAAX protease family)